MSDLPSSIAITEEGPREGFQIEAGPIATTDKIRLIDALSDTGVKSIQVCSFVFGKGATTETAHCGIKPVNTE